MPNITGNDIIVVDETHEKLDVQWRHLAGFGNVVFDICFDSRGTDDITEAIKSGTYCFPTGFELLPTLVKPGKKVLDLGAHIGTFSLLAASLGYETMAVDASPRNLALLKLSASRNNLTNLKIIFAATSDFVGQIEFVQAGPYGVVANEAVRADTTISVPTVTVDKLLADANWEGDVGFIKMDVEGSEVATVRGMAKLLEQDNAPDILFESNGHTLHFFGQTPASLIRSLESFGYRCYLVHGRSLIPVQGGDFQPDVCVDYLATKRPLHSLKKWRIREPLSDEEIVLRIVSTTTHPNPHARRYLARALEDARPAIRSDIRVRTALYLLHTDADQEVRDAIQWWQPTNQSPDDLRQMLLELSLEVVRLQSWVARYEQGKFMRMMRKLKRLQVEIARRFGL